MSVMVVQPLSHGEMIDSKEAAELAHLRSATLAQWRYLRKFEEELPYFKVGRKVLYRKADVYAFIESCRIGGANALEDK